jgi:succinate dehydrogenase / fumarate reductase flavoprotein subunit
MAIQQEVIVVGGGLAGLSAAMRLAEHGILVHLVSLTKVKRSHSVCAQGGINAAVNLKNEGDSPYIHAYETVKGGDFLANQPQVVEMCLAAPQIIKMLDRFGCTFNRNLEGGLDVRRFGGTTFNRTVYCGSSTGQQLLYALDEQVRRYEVKGLVKKYEHHEFMRLVLDEEGIARGIILMDHYNLKLEVLKANAVIIGTGGLGFMFKKSTNSTICTGAANGRLFMQGMEYANGEFIQIHPTSIPGHDKLRLMTETLRGFARVWVFGDETKQIKDENGNWIPCGKTGERWYFLEDMYKLLGNLVPRDIAARAIHQVCELGLGVEGHKQVYLDCTGFDESLVKKFQSVFEIYQKFTGEDPKVKPMKIYPGVHYTMGGAFVDYPAEEDGDRHLRFKYMTNLTGCFNVGESQYGIHGANRLGGNSLISCIFDGLVVGDEMQPYFHQLKKDYKEIPEEVFERALAKEQAFKHELMSKKGVENIHQLHEELSEILVRDCTVVRHNESLEKAVEEIKKIRERYKNIRLDDTSNELNQTFIFANQFRGMLEIALVVAKGALLRDESRGGHFKPEFPDRDDVHFLKHTIATYDPNREEPVMSFRDVDTRYFTVAKRDYKKKVTLESLDLSKIPSNLPAYV